MEIRKGGSKPGPSKSLPPPSPPSTSMKSAVVVLHVTTWTYVDNISVWSQCGGCSGAELDYVLAVDDSFNRIRTSCQICGTEVVYDLEIAETLARPS